MAILEGAVSGALAEVSPINKALLVHAKPHDALAWNSISAVSGLITTIAANGPVFSFRNIGANPIMIRRVGVGFVCTTAFAAAQTVGYGLMIARAFTASDSAGTAITVTGNNGKHQTSMATPTSIDCRISATAVVTAGTRTLDTNYISQINGWIGAIGATIPIALNNLFSVEVGDYPIILAQNEGVVIANTILMGATGVGNFYVNLEFAEMTTY